MKLQLDIDGANVTWVVSDATRTEALHAPWSLQVTVQSFDANKVRHDVPASTLLTKKAHVTWVDGGADEPAATGLVERVDEVSTGYLIGIVPRIALLADAVDHQVFLDIDAVEMAKAVLGEHHIAVDSKVVRALPKGIQRVQGFESDLAFVSRILAEEGITWRLVGDDKVLLTDDPSGFPDVAKLPVRERGGMLTEESVHHLQLRQAKAPDQYTLRDYDFAAPMVDLTASATAGKAHPRAV